MNLKKNKLTSKQMFGVLSIIVAFSISVLSGYFFKNTPFLQLYIVLIIIGLLLLVKKYKYGAIFLVAGEGVMISYTMIDTLSAMLPVDYLKYILVNLYVVRIFLSMGFTTFSSIFWFTKDDDNIKVIPEKIEKNSYIMGLIILVLSYILYNYIFKFDILKINIYYSAIGVAFINFTGFLKGLKAKEFWLGYIAISIIYIYMIYMKGKFELSFDIVSLMLIISISILGYFIWWKGEKNEDIRK